MEIVALMSMEVQMRVIARECGDHITPRHLKWKLASLQQIPMNAIANALRGQESENSQEALRVLDIILKQHAAKQ
jgi:hypothetical protein